MLEIRKILKTISYITVGQLVGFLSSFMVMYLLDQYPDTKNNLLKGDKSNYTALAFAVMLSLMLIGGLVGFVLGFM